ncbi:MAG: alginate export family protein, partial [Myxococcales bacterium]|nr:alginate export family protein [Myxococcales bacterium]
MAAFFQTRPFAAQTTVEAYVLGLHERESSVAPSSSRQLITPGVRVLRPPMLSEVDYQLEVMAQFGSSRASSESTDRTQLDHVAFSMHASSGFLFDVPSALRLVLQYD